MSKNQEIAQRVLELVGGKENVVSVVHCATRLRFKLKDEEKAQTDKLNQDPDVIQVVRSGGQYQVVIGSHVSDVHKELLAISGLGESTQVASDAPKGNIFSQLIDIISSIFTPFLGAMAGAGVLKGFLTLAVTMNWLEPAGGVYTVFWAIADGIFTFLPVILALTAAKKFDTSPYLAMCLAMALVHPSITGLAGETLKFAGIPVIIGKSAYTSSVIPIILAVYVQKYVERFFKKIVPSFLQIICVPLAVFFVMAPLTFILIGPIGTVIGDALGAVYSTIYNISPIIAGAIMGGFWQVFVMFGMHWGFVPIMMLNLEGGAGFDTMAPMLLPAVLAQGGAAFAVFLMSKNVKLKGLALSSTITSIFGITEPTVYGVTLPLKKPFIAACIGGAVGGAFVGLSNVKNYVFGLISVMSVPGFIDPATKDTSGAIAAIIGTAIAFVVAFVLTFILKFEDPKENAAADDSEATASNKTNNEKIVLASPLTGTVLKLADVEDQVFASGALGNGLAINPTVGELYAPADGEITTIFPTGHAVGLTSVDGAEILMHIGMDTVEMNGDGFEAFVKQGDQVKKGDLLVKFDIEKIQAAGHPIVTPVVVTNTKDYLDVLDMEQTDVLHGEDFLAIVR